MIIWFTGLSGAGKSTLAQGLKNKLLQKGKLAYVLDGDNIRKGLCSDLTFSTQDRHENLRRIAEVAKLFSDAGFIVIVSFITPYQESRNMIKGIIPDLHSIYIKASIETCKKRDVKGLYKKALAGEIPNFTGISDEYQEPSNPDFVINTENHDIDSNIKKLYNYLFQK